MPGNEVNMLIKCPECDHNISDKAISCPMCGFPLQQPKVTVARKTKRHRKLPNGTGSIKKLSGKRAKPWAAYPPATKFSLSGSPILDPALGYFETYNQAFEALMVYNNAPEHVKTKGSATFADLCAALMSATPQKTKSYQYTFAELYERYYDSKYVHCKKKLSVQSEYSTSAAYANCKVLHNRIFAELKKDDFQSVIDNCKLKHSSLELIVSLIKGMSKYALQNDLIDKDYSQYITINIPDDDESGVPFTQEELDLLWSHSGEPDVNIILLMIYTGFRISAYKDIKYDMEKQFFQGGVKTKSGKNRIVPLHPAVQDFAKEFYLRYQHETFRVSVVRQNFKDTLARLGISTSIKSTQHTPHDCRHTFSWLCDKYGVDTLTKHMLMGHSLGNDVEQSVYGHRTFEELKEGINKIEVKNLKS